MVAAAISAAVGGAAIAASLGFLGVLAGLWVNGDRTERARRRELHARALAALCEYGEMPFMIRRRRCEPEQRSAERVRISDHFSAVKAEIQTCEVLLGADGHERVAAAYRAAVGAARATVGREAHDAWKDEPITSDTEMNMGPLFERIAEFREELAQLEVELAWATLPRRRQAWRTLRRRRPRPTTPGERGRFGESASTRGKSGLQKPETSRSSS